MVRRKWERLVEGVRGRGRVLVAFSGGCDSAFLWAAALRALGRENVLAVTAVSPSLSQREKESVQAMAELLRGDHRFLSTDEMNNPSYTANPSNRCFFCKDELFSKLEPIAHEMKMVIADGYNASDRSDFRPGLAAAHARQVVHPLDEADLDKRSIRILSRWLKLPTWNRPASPCLSSRIPHGTEVTSAILRQIEKAEEVLRSEAFTVVRVRHYGKQARIEVPLEEISRLEDPARWKKIEVGILACGYEEVVLDRRGFQSGRLNEQPDWAPASAGVTTK